jgi:hypothetical protein
MMTQRPAGGGCRATSSLVMTLRVLVGDWAWKLGLEMLAEELVGCVDIIDSNP